MTSRLPFSRTNTNLRPSAPRQRLGLIRLEDRLTPSFTAPVSYPVGGTTPNWVLFEAMASGDFNEDGHADLAVPGSSLQVLLGNGSGSFQPGWNADTGGEPQSLRVADFNADGHDDILAVELVGLKLYRGNGDGTLQAPVYSPGSFANFSAAVADVNNDGFLDVATIMVNTYWDEGVLTVWLGQSGGTFGGVYIYSYFWATGGLELGDFDEDGNADAVVGYWRTYLGNGDGTMTGFEVNDLFVSGVADFNSDGHLDLLTAGSISLGNGDGTFQSPVMFNGSSAAGWGKNDVIGDINGDGMLDIAAGILSGDRVAVNLGHGDGTFSNSMLFSVNPTGPYYSSDVIVGDWNADGRDDVAVLRAGVVDVMLSQNDWPALNAPSVSIADASVIEGNSGTTAMNFTVTLSAPASQPVSIQYATANGTAIAGTDYTASIGTVTFAPGETSKTITINAVGDTTAEVNETFTVNLHDPSGLAISDGSAIGTIVNDDFTIAISDINITEGNTGTSSANVIVTLSGASSQTVTVQFLTANGSATAGSDYQSSGGTVTFTPGQTSQSISVPVIGDRLPESTENFFVNLSSPTNATIADSQAVATILDNEPRVSINDVSMNEGNSGTKNFVFTVTLSAAYDQAVTMSFRTVNGTATTGNNDYVAQNGTLSFSAGQTSKTITIQVKGDKKKESNETFQVELFNLSSNALFTDNWGLGTILNDD